jgi:hypothetical protein
MFVSQWQCPQAEIATIGQVYDSLIRPIEQELVTEGTFYGAGMFFHQWGDEWNVNWYRLAQDRDAVFDAIAEVSRRLQERHPDQTTSTSGDPGRRLRASKPTPKAERPARRRAFCPRPEHRHEPARAAPHFPLLIRRTCTEAELERSDLASISDNSFSSAHGTRPLAADQQ